jgi:predicted AAA+ superfamily ATPase
VSKELSFNNLRKTLHIASTNSVADYVHWLEESYLVFLVPRFSWSLKQMLINPKKLYAIDNGLIQANTLSFSVDKGRMLENAVFLYLKQKFEKVYYFKDKNECDFVVFNANACKGVFQVCYEVTTDNQTREFNGLVEAMNFFNLTKGIIITYNQNDQLTYHGKEIELVSGMDYFI